MQRGVKAQSAYALLGVLRDTDDVVRIPLDDEVETVVPVYPPLPDVAVLIVLFGVK